MPLELPTIKKGVYNRLPYLLSNEVNDTLIDEFTAEMLLMFGPVLDLDMTDDNVWLEINNYPACVKGLMPDLVACTMLARKVIENLEGDGSTTTSTKDAGRYLKKAKAGETEVEYDINKEKKNTVAYLTADQLMNKFMKQAEAKAKGCGLCLVFVDCELQGVNTELSALPTLIIRDWE